MELNDKIVIYRTADGQTSIDVKLEDETVWLSANQMANLFDRDEKTIRKHINNVFSEGELEKENNTHFLRVDGVKQPVAFYSLDVIISIGYRVKSQRGTQFRIWANRVLKEYLVKGYAVNKALTEQRYTELKQLVTVLGRTVKAQEALTSEDALNLVEVVSDYAYALDTLDRYDYQQLAVEQTTNEIKFHATYEGAMQAIEELKEKFGGSQWFAHEKDDSFKSFIGQIYQTFGRQNLYPSVEEKAFYDILKSIAKQFGFEYPEEKLLKLAAEIKTIVADKSKYTDWSTRDDIKAELKMDLILILAEYGYPPVTNDEVFKEILEQAENFKKYNG